MEKYGKVIGKAYSDFAHYLWDSIVHPGWDKFFWWTVLLSAFFFALELLRPWRKAQPRFRKDFWLDLFYIAFNFFLFSLLAWSAGQALLGQLFNDFIGLFGLQNIVAFHVHRLPVWAYSLVLFMVGDFVSWNVHRMLHRVPWMWELHKVHHSVEQMGFAAHIRYHWMENVIYWACRFLPFAVLGADLSQIFAVHVLNLAWGHFNHANITVQPRVTGTILGLLLGLGLASLYAQVWWMWLAFPAAGIGVFGLVLGKWMRYLFNSPEMHLWHHAEEWPTDRPHGINFGITLAIWDYLWGTGRLPRVDADVKLGFAGLERFPKGFLGQLVHGLAPKSPDRRE